MESFGRYLLVWVLLAAAAAALPRVSDPEQKVIPSVHSATAPSRAEVSSAIAAASSYLEHACGPDGKFTYKVDTTSGRESSSYDIIRHAGAIYALAMANGSQSDPNAVSAITRAAKFLRENYIGPGVRPGQLAVWSQPLTEGSGGHRSSARERYAELGGVGLGLVALVAARRVDPNSVPLEELQALGRFALFLQRDDGSFVHKYKQNSGPVTKWTSLYYPGEAALGFIALYEVDHSIKWLTASGKSLSQLAKGRAGLTKVPADHWALIATAKLLPHCDHELCGISREELVRHAIQICNSILRDEFRNSTATGLDGSFDPTGRTAPTATRLEGLLAALEFLPNGILRKRIEGAAGRGIAFLLRAQINSGRWGGGVPGTITAGTRDASEIRIDYVQHTICAFIRYQEIYQRDPHFHHLNKSVTGHCHANRADRFQPQ